MNNSFLITAFFVDRGQPRPFSLKIEGPFSTPDNKSFYCRLDSPELLGKEFNIYGNTQEETQKLAVKFIEICLQGKNVQDIEGKAMELNPWKK